MTSYESICDEPKHGKNLMTSAIINIITLQLTLTFSRYIMHVHKRFVHVTYPNELAYLGINRVGLSGWCKTEQIHTAILLCKENHIEP